MNINKVKWQSRRGMLELDLLLNPFIENYFKDLSLTQQKLYWQLLAEEDNDLWRWLLELEKPPKHLTPIVQIIIQSRKG